MLKKIILTSIFSASILHAANYNNKAMVFAAGALTSAIVNNELANTSVYKAAAHLTCSHPRDLAHATTISCALLATHYFLCKPNQSTPFFHLALSVPLAKIVATLPIWANTCDPTSYTHSICNKCKLSKTFRELIFLTLIAGGIQKLHDLV